MEDELNYVSYEEDTGLESNLDYIVEQICSKEPSPPNSIQLQLTDNSIGNVNNKSELELNKLEFSIVKDITLKMMKYLFGENADPSVISQKDFYLLKQYVNSIGYTVDVICEETEENYIYKIKFDRYQ
jgi:hypothetical protein